MSTRKIECSVSRDKNKIHLYLTIPAKDIVIQYTLKDNDPDDLVEVQSTIHHLNSLIDAMKANDNFACLFERFFESITYTPKDILHRSGRLKIQIGDPWEHLLAIELLADDIVDDFKIIKETLESIEKSFEC